MYIARLAINRVRRFDTVELAVPAGPGLNLITGDNGAGKSSILEALHVMAYGRSFRGRVRDGLVQQGRESLEIFVEWEEHSAAGGSVRRRAGLRHTGQTWEGRLDGETVLQLGNLCAALAVVTFEPGSHVLISGGSEPRRRFLDWGLFHVEPDFLPLWRRYSRALKQRNALLKAGGAAAALDAWDHELAETGTPLTSRRQHYLDRLQERAVEVAAQLAPGLGLQQLDFSPGWRRGELSLADALLMARERDRLTGYTSVGPHRADWTVGFCHIGGRDQLSRGQAKLTALSCLLAQAEDFADQRGEWPVICLDDLGSELDRTHQGRLLHWLAASPAQIWITATESPAGLLDAALAHTTFHVEHGQVIPTASAPRPDEARLL